MTVPRYLASTFQFDTDLNGVDGADIDTSLKTMLLAQTPPWINTTGDVMQSPVDSAGRFMTLELTAPAAGRFVITVKDQNNIQVCARAVQLISGPSPTTINYYTGQYHVYIESLTGGSASGEWVSGIMVDPTGYDLEDNQNYVMGGGTRNSAGANDGAGGVCDQWFMLDSGAPQLRQRSRAVNTSIGLNVGLLDFAGNTQLFSFDVLGIPSGSSRWMGSMYQAQILDPSCAAGIIKPLAIDDSTPAQFRTTVAPATSQLIRLAIRVA